MQELLFSSTKDTVNSSLTTEEDNQFWSMLKYFVLKYCDRVPFNSCSAHLVDLTILPLSLVSCEKDNPRAAFSQSSFVPGKARTW